MCQLKLFPNEDFEGQPTPGPHSGTRDYSVPFKSFKNKGDYCYEMRS